MTIAGADMLETILYASIYSGAVLCFAWALFNRREFR